MRFDLWKRTKMEWSMSSLARHGKSIGVLVGCLSLWSGVVTLAGAQTPPPASPKTAETPKTTVAAPAKPGAVMQLKMELTGEFAYRFLLPNAKELPAPTPLPASTGGMIALPISADASSPTVKGATLEIFDNARGNLARLPVKTDTVTSVGESAFRFVQVVYVPIQVKGGKPVTDAQVTLLSKTYPRKVWLLKPADNGVARFDNVPLDEPVTIGVSYAANPPKSVMETLSKAHPAEGIRREPILLEWADVKTSNVVPVASPGVPPVAGTPVTPGTTSAPALSPGTPAPELPSSNPFSGIISSIIGLAFVGGIGYGLFRAYESGKLSGVFNKLGINVAPPGTGGDPAVSPFAKPERAPITPITDGTADPLVGGMSAGMGQGGGGSVSYSAPTNGARLVASAGLYSGSVFPLDGVSLDIGRDPGNPIALPNDTNVSRRHATLRNEGGQFVIIDNDSSNGTFVNGVRIASQTPTPLRSGDEATIGGTRFRFEG